LIKDDLSLPELAPLKVSVAGYEVKFDKNRKLWYADLRLDPGASYVPYIKLAMTRFQPNSLIGNELSSIVLADPIQLLPTREAVLEYLSDDDRVRISVRGISYLASFASRGPSKMHVRVQELCKDLEGDLRWAPTSGSDSPILLQHSIGPGMETIWTGEIRLPASRKDQNFQLIIEETEPFQVDDGKSIDSQSVPLDRRSFTATLDV
jgi:hypothetical protein